MKIAQSWCRKQKQRERGLLKMQIHSLPAGGASGAAETSLIFHDLDKINITFPDFQCLE